MFDGRRLELRKVFLSGLMRLIWEWVNLLGQQKWETLLLMAAYCPTRVVI